VLPLVQDQVNEDQLFQLLYTVYTSIEYECMNIDHEVKIIYIGFLLIQRLRIDY